MIRQFVAIANNPVDAMQDMADFLLENTGKVTYLVSSVHPYGDSEYYGHLFYDVNKESK